MCSSWQRSEFDYISRNLLHTQYNISHLQISSHCPTDGKAWDVYSNPQKKTYIWLDMVLIPCNRAGWGTSNIGRKSELSFRGWGGSTPINRRNSSFSFSSRASSISLSRPYSVTAEATQPWSPGQPSASSPFCNRRTWRNKEDNRASELDTVEIWTSSFVAFSSSRASNFAS